MKSALLLVVWLGFLSGAAQAADLYKCSVGGHTSYQDRPCAPASRQTRVDTRPAGSMVGCYVAKFSAFDGGGSGRSERFEIRATAPSEFELRMQGETLPMKTATPEELRDLSKGFQVRLLDGVSMKWPAGTPDQKPVGVYRGRDKDGKELILAFFFLSNGPATRVACH